MTFSQTKIFITSEVPISQIFAEDGNSTSGSVSDQMRQMMDDLVSILVSWVGIPS